MTTEIDICNMALLRCGANTVASTDGTVANIVISDIGDESNVESQMCTLYYENVRDIVTEDRIWSFALKQAILDTPEATTPLFGYGNSFQKPTDSLNIWRVSYNNVPVINIPDYSNSPWRVEGNFIYADSERIMVEYIRRMDDTNDINLFSTQFINAFSLRLAVEFATSLTENVGLYERLTREYQARLVDASSIDGGQATHETFISNNFIRNR